MLFKNFSLSWFVIFLILMIDNTVLADAYDLNEGVKATCDSIRYTINSNWLLCIIIIGVFCVFLERKNIANKRFRNLFLVFSCAIPLWFVGINAFVRV